MCRPLRILFNALTVLSLVLAIGVAVLYVGSYWRVGHVVRIPVQGGRFAQSQSAVILMRGGLAIDLVRSPAGDLLTERRVELRSWPSVNRSGGSALRWPTVTTITTRGPKSATQTLITIGLWLPLLVLSIPPLMWGVLKLRQSRRHTAGLCASCGYDLRATPERCPECGAVPAAG